jgi:hypothetical protein
MTTTTDIARLREDAEAARMAMAALGREPRRPTNGRRATGEVEAAYRVAERAYDRWKRLHGIAARRWCDACKALEKAERAAKVLTHG